MRQAERENITIILIDRSHTLLLVDSSKPTILSLWRNFMEFLHLENGNLFQSTP